MRLVNYSLLSLSLLLGACASTGSGDGRVSIATASNGQEFSGASCVVTTGAGSWNITTPATLQVRDGYGELRIVCNRIGYRTSELRLPPYSSGSGSSMGVGLGGGSGGVGVGLGFGFPIMTSSGGYPSRVVVNMVPQ
jgi:uncharacterized membrane protein YfcA